MAKRPFVMVALLTITGMILPFGGRTLAQASTGYLDRTRLQAPRPAAGAGHVPLGNARGPRSQRHEISVRIELTDTPAARVFDQQRQHAPLLAANQATRGQIAQIDRAQQQLVTRLEGAACHATLSDPTRLQQYRGPGGRAGIGSYQGAAGGQVRASTARVASGQCQQRAADRRARALGQHRA